MALYAAVHYGCRVTTTTLSREQYAYTQRRIEEQGLQDRITLLLEDYRDLEGQFDKLVSIEMIEAVGHRFLPQYFRQCARLLKPDGLMLLQAITIRDQRYERARRSVDFIQRYIFPGGALPSVQKMVDLATRETDMNLVHMEDFGEHYARTCACGTTTFARRARSLSSWATTSSSIGSGSSTCATARAASSSGPSHRPAAAGQARGAPGRAGVARQRRAPGPAWPHQAPGAA